MALYPVILCGGAGSRLWPASRPSRPKQFIALAGNRSLFQETIERVAELASGGGHLVVVAGTAHSAIIADQLSEIGVAAQVLLEPQARDSAAAMAAAAAWVQRRHPEGIIAFLASDHYVPDAAAFRRSIEIAAQGASTGQIVTLGMRPRYPSSAYGYIRPSGPGLSRVSAFHEKPELDVAAQLIGEGFLWNSGNFIVSATTLMTELEKHAPAVLDAATKALPSATTSSSVQILSEAFLDSPKISIDYAVMEVTTEASVLETDFEWSDLGSWDSIAASGEGSTGMRILEDSERILTRAPDGVMVAALGVNNLAIIVEPDAVLVCDLSRSLEIKKIVDRIKTISPRHFDFEEAVPEILTVSHRRFSEWLRLRALPVWSTLGLGEDGGFLESLTLGGRSSAEARRARVQARQIYVYAAAGRLGWKGPWRKVLASAHERLSQVFIKADGSTRSLVASDGSVIDDTSVVYDQAFLLYAMAALKAAGCGSEDLEGQAIGLRTLLLSRALPNGALREAGEKPFQSNAHMHLLEAAMAWEDQGLDPGWAELSDRLVSIAKDTFIDRDGGFVREFFNEDWTPAHGDDGRLVEPGHQFEWAWLMARYAQRRHDSDAFAVALRLYGCGRQGIGQRPNVALDAMNEDMTIRSGRARLWPQTEWLKAALILAEMAQDNDRDTLLADAAAAYQALWLYVTPDGLWRDKRLPNGQFIDEPAPASSFYHIFNAYEQMHATLVRLGQVRDESLIG
jgi:mannose-1-phosphate guanylyltransferase/mannose-6-phosphate isomerase